MATYATSELRFINTGERSILEDCVRIVQTSALRLLSRFATCCTLHFVPREG